MEVNMVDFKLIPLSQGKFAKVSEEDYDHLMQWKWYAWWEKHTNSFYAIRNDQRSGKTRLTIRMHRVLCGLAAGDPRCVDHINHDTLDNRRGNLRVATATNNVGNKRIHRNNKTGFKGVQFHARNKVFAARIGIPGGKRKYLGNFATAHEAAMAYDNAAREIFGPFALTNFGGSHGS